MHRLGLVEESFVAGADTMIDLTFALVETGLRGWAYETRTAESDPELSDWNCVTTSPKVGASPAAETLRVRAA